VTDFSSHFPPPGSIVGKTPKGETLPLFAPAGTYKPLPKKAAAGGIVVRDLTLDGITQVLMIKPANGWNRGLYTFPKGTIDQGETPMEACYREVAEESGRFASFFPYPYLGQGEGSMSITKYFLCCDDGPTPWGHDFETEAVMWVRIDEAIHYLAENKSGRDETIARKARRRIGQAYRILRLSQQK